MNLLQEIDKIWWDKNKGIEEKLNTWLDSLNDGAENLGLAKKEFHRWAPLGVYVSVTKARGRGVFSLRFLGQEVAKLIVKNEEVYLELSGHADKNKKWFAVTLADGRYLWRGPQAKLFRSAFKDLELTKKGAAKVRSLEHRIESKFIIEMSKGSGKFGLEDLRIQPVVIAAKFPLQMPVPISANTGKPESTTGYIDILARHRLKNNRTNLSVWELKKPGAYQHAASQAYIYAATLLHVIRHLKRGAEWLKLFGFNYRKVPDSLEIEAVVAIDRNQKASFEKERDILAKDSLFRVGNDRIRLFAAYYREEAEAITLERNPFIECN